MLAAASAWNTGFAQERGGPTTLEVVPGTSSYVNVSSRMINEVIVPFANPRVVQFLRPDTTASINRDGMSIYVSTGTEEFIQLIIKNADTPDEPGISLTLIPVEDVPPQHIRIQPIGASALAGGGGAAAPAAQLSSSDYEDMLRELVREAARDEIPSGFGADPNWNGTRLTVGGIVGEPLKRVTGSSLAIEYFMLRNTGSTAIELVEPNFANAGVRAIAFVNYVLLAPGQSTRMVWVRDR